MLKKYNPIIRSIIFFSDAFILFGCWVVVYLLRFKIYFIPHLYVAPSFLEHLKLLPYILLVYFVVFNWLGMYQPMRVRKIPEQFFTILKASIGAVVVFVFLLYFLYNDYRYSRITLIIFSILNIIVLSIFRIAVISVLRLFRRNGYNLKYVLIVGSGVLAKFVAEKLFQHLEFGYSVMGFLSRTNKDVGKEVINAVKIIGTYKDLPALVKQRFDQVIFCLDSNEERLIRPLVNQLDNEGVDVKIVLELGNVFTLRNNTEDLDGISILSLRESPLTGWMSVPKRILDIIVSLLGLIIFAPFMSIIVLGIKLTSSGPVFYSQDRVGMNGARFKLYKFRSMISGAESQSGAIFAKKSDPRVTKIGRLLRRFSLDEMPQLLNVLKGDLSLVGPRPERQKFVDEFYQKIPRYILRHKIKLGMTGWAQVNGLRGDSSIQERLNYDLYYIEHWSFWFDLKIIFLTFYAVFKGDGAY